MAQVAQYDVSLREVGEYILSKNGITEGKWMVGVSFGVNVGNSAFAPSQPAKPTAAVSVDGLAITRISEEVAVDEPIEHLVIDASTLPKP